MPKPYGSPQCFADDLKPNELLWSGAATECAGGHDPAYTNPKDGTHRRERCSWYQRCADTTAAIRTRQHTAPYNAPVQALPKPIQQYQQQYQQLGPRPVQQPSYPQQAASVVQHPGQYVPPYVAQEGPQVVPAPVQQIGAQMPGYLSVPEPYDAYTPWYKRLVRELIRSLLKATGHTTASFIDHTPFVQHKKPEE